MKTIDPKYEEIFVILQEECAEVIQEVSKCRRFGIDGRHRDGMSHREKLTTEVGDLQCMIDLLISHGIVDPEAVNAANAAKAVKLHIYSDIYKE
jgi:hypothetical protein